MPMATQRGIDHLRDECSEQRGLAPLHPRSPASGIMAARRLAPPPMCANYRPASREALSTLPLPPPDFGYGEAYPGSVVPVVPNFAPRQWVPAIFGLVPAWAHDLKIIRLVILPDEAWGDWLRAKSESAARAFLRGFDSGAFVAEPAPR